MERVTFDELLARHGMDPATLPVAPADPSRQEMRDRCRILPGAPCMVCDEYCATTSVANIPGHGPRWVDLCWRHFRGVTKPAPGVPSTMEGILADIRAAADEVGLSMREMSAEEWGEMGRRARRHR
jgi:hypothetical protein